MRVHPKPKRAKTSGCHEEGCGEWRTGRWGNRNEKQHSPTVEGKEIYSMLSVKPHEKYIYIHIFFLLV